MRFEHLIQINDPSNPLIASLSVEQTWDGLMRRVTEPELFLPGLERCVILARLDNRVERELHFGQAMIRDAVEFEEHQWVSFTSHPNAHHAGGKLTIKLETPEVGQLFLRFTYETGLAEGMVQDGVQVAEYIKSAYRQSDLDTVRTIRLLASGGSLH